MLTSINVCKKGKTVQTFMNGLHFLVEILFTVLALIEPEPDKEKVIKGVKSL